MVGASALWVNSMSRAAREATGWIVPGEARLLDERAQVRRLPAEQADAMELGRVLSEATAG